MGGMVKSAEKTTPRYPLQSVDNVLRLLQILRDTGEVRLQDAANDLGLAKSTVHRLLSMLCYRDFAVQAGDRRYYPGPGLSAEVAPSDEQRQIRANLRPHLEAFSTWVGETINLVVRVGTSVRFLDSVEGPKVLRIGDRRGAIFPAKTTAAGKAMLAELEENELTKLYRSTLAEFTGEYLDSETFTSLVKSLDAVRAAGLALNSGQVESSVLALGVAARARPDSTIAVTITVPSEREHVVRDPQVWEGLRTLKRLIEEDTRSAS